MIETIEGAQTALRKHVEWCQRLVCTECDANADVIDLLTVLRRVIERDCITSTESHTLLARAPIPNDGSGVTPTELIHE